VKITQKVLSGSCASFCVSHGITSCQHADCLQVFEAVKCLGRNVLLACDQVFLLSGSSSSNIDVFTCWSTLGSSGSNDVIMASCSLYWTFVFTAVSGTQLLSAVSEWSLSSIARNGMCQQNLTVN